MADINYKLFIEAKRYIPGGVNSPLRAFKAVGGSPVFIKSGKGSKIYSQDGKEFIDYCMGFGPLILGHTHPAVIDALEKAVKDGACFGAPTRLETELARVITKAVPSIEKIRLTNSGTEAVMTALRLARAYTQRDKVLKFEGSYHGHADYLLNCQGIPKDFRKHTIASPYNNIEKVRALVEKYKKALAAIIVEPVAANMGVVLPKHGFLEGLRRITEKYNIVLVFDEVITGFRLLYGGSQRLFDIKPDLTCLGKIIGGGLPIGAVGGKKEIMELLAPQGNVYQAGTFSGNPISVSAGLAALKVLAESGPYSALEGRTRYLCETIKQKAGECGIKIKLNFIGSMFSLCFANKEVMDYNMARVQDTGLFKRLYQRLLKEGIYFSPSGFEANFLSTAHTGEDVEKTLRAIDKTFKNLKGG